MERPDYADWEDRPSRAEAEAEARDQADAPRKRKGYSCATGTCGKDHCQACNGEDYEEEDDGVERMTPEQLERYKKMLREDRERREYFRKTPRRKFFN